MLGVNGLNSNKDADKDPQTKTNQLLADVDLFEDSHLVLINHGTNNKTKVQSNTFDESDLAAKGENTKLVQHYIPILSHPDINYNTIPYSESIFRKLFRRPPYLKKEKSYIM